MVPSMDNLYLDELTSDVRFAFHDGQSVVAHKNLLNTDVFENMFRSTWRDKDVIEMKDGNADSFREFLQIFYFSKYNFNFTLRNIDMVKQYCRKYNTANGLRACLEFSKYHLTPENATITATLSANWTN